MSTYQIITDATADHCPRMLDGLPALIVIPMGVHIAGKDYLYGPGGNLTAEEFYQLQEQGNYATTSQISPNTFTEFFESVLQKGTDVIYLGFSSGLSGTFQAAKLAAEDLIAKYPERKLYCIDTLCAAVGQGYFIWEALYKQKEGYTIEELADWAGKERLKVCHWFTVDTLDHLRHGGRVSAVSAVVGDKLNIKPLLHVDEEGKLAVMQKPRGRKRAMKAQLDYLNRGWEPEGSRRILIGHGDCMDRAQELKEEVAKAHPDAEIEIADIGPVIGAHTGPGMLALIFWGSTR